MARTGQQLRMRTAKAMARDGSGPRTTTAAGSRMGDRLRYRFDNSMSRGTPALIAWLSVVTLLSPPVMFVLPTDLIVPVATVTNVRERSRSGTGVTGGISRNDVR